MSQDVRRQHPPPQSYVHPPRHGNDSAHYDMGRIGKLPPTAGKTLDDELSESSTRGSSPSTDWSYAESSQSSRGTSIPPDEVLSLNGASTNSDCGGEGDCESPRLPKGSDSPRSPSTGRRELRDNLPMRSTPNSPSSHPNSRHAPNEAVCDDTSSDSDPESDSDEDNDWSQDDGLESTVIAAVGGNLALASYLIPIIHKNRNVEYAKMIHAWQSQGVLQCSPGDNHQGSPTFSSTTAGTGSGSGGSGGPFKKRKRSNSDDFGRREDEGDDDDDGSADRASPAEAGSTVLLLACPFHKKDPVKYSAKCGAAGGKKTKSYRTCAGPGWKTIQRLKEHLRRNHSPVQCSRCFRTFNESEKAQAMMRLQQHQREDQQCQVGDQSLREGISEVQWAELDKKKAKKQDGERVGKWFEIWDILFYDTSRPSTPFYYWASGPHSYPTSSPGKDQLMNSFGHILDHMVRSRDIDFNQDYQHIRNQLINVAGTAFDLYRSTSGGSSEDSSSLTKTNTGSKESGETHQTAATSVTLPVSPVSPSNQTRNAPQQQYHNPAIPRSMPGTQYSGVPLGRGPTMMTQMQTQVPRSPPMAQMTNFQPAYYTMPTNFQATPTAWPMAQPGFEGTTQFMDTNGMSQMYYPMPEAWDGSS
ncbi:uncharacterized protein MKZ38_003338 [Zalerion maritima]|uniref:C2H2-type domain-containing protein n=1 Tax=Zalerion maritima TaxID=339359 RepID=A0AAD5WQR0_9PEZI|nr:uncharacterized protein MKZ38_003338 [Zalerion maritima]